MVFPLKRSQFLGLKHSECFFTMNLGRSIFSPRRYNFRTLAFYNWWEKEDSLEHFLSSHVVGKKGWHIKIKPYRKWGDVKEIASACIYKGLNKPTGIVVAVTLARLKLSETIRFAKWGKPVEAQVRDDSGKLFALSAMRPFNTFCTFSIWESEENMVEMVQGKKNQLQHLEAMKERSRKPFHFEFTTMRFVPIEGFNLQELSL